jgi:membrane protein required for colicin V production
MDKLGWVDLGLLAVLIVSLVLGVWRGFVLEVLALLGWVAAYLAAQWLAPVWAPHLPVGEPGSALNHAAAFAIAFLAVLIGWGLLSRVIGLLVKATPLQLADRVLGAAFGVVRGLVLLLVLTTVVALTPAAASPLWHESQGAQWLAVALHEIKPLLPREVAQFLPA